MLLLGYSKLLLNQSFLRSNRASLKLLGTSAKLTMIRVDFPRPSHPSFLFHLFDLGLKLIIEGYYFCLVVALPVEPSFCRSSHQKHSMKKGDLKNIIKFTGKHPCQSIFFDKVADLGPGTLLKRDSGTDIFL